MAPKRIPADRLLFAMISSLRTLVVMLDKKGVLDADEFADTRRRAGVVKMAQKRIPADRLLFGIISSLRTLVVMLDKKGVLDADDFAEALQETAAHHRATGDPNNLADAIHAISMHTFESKI